MIIKNFDDHKKAYATVSFLTVATKIAMVAQQNKALIGAIRLPAAVYTGLLYVLWYKRSKAAAIQMTVGLAGCAIGRRCTSSGC